MGDCNHHSIYGNRFPLFIPYRDLSFSVGPQVEAQLARENQGWRLAEFSNTDYHLSGHIGKGRTEIILPALSSAGFLEAVRAGQTRAPEVTRKLDAPEAMIGAGLAVTRCILTGMRIPKD